MLTIVSNRTVRWKVPGKRKRFRTQIFPSRVGGPMFFVPLETKLRRMNEVKSSNTKTSCLSQQAKHGRGHMWRGYGRRLVGWLVSEKKRESLFLFSERCSCAYSWPVRCTLSCRYAFSTFSSCGCFGRLARLVCYSHCSFSVESM